MSNDLTVSNNTQSMLAEKKLSEEQFLAAKNQALKVTSYIGADTVDVNEFLNVPIKVVGAVVHDCTVGQDTVDKSTGEMGRTYSEELRTVFKLDDGRVIAFVSKAAVSFAQQVLFPCFGIGDFSYPVTLKIKQISSSKGRTYSFQIID